MTLEEIKAKNALEISNWMKRLNRQGPFFLYKSQPHYENSWNEDQTKTVRIHKGKMEHWCIWHDANKGKTKYGYFYDGMYTRYGVQTVSVLNGETPFDVWNGSCITNEEFQEMLNVRLNRSTLPKFELTSIKDIRI